MHRRESAKSQAQRPEGRIASFSCTGLGRKSFGDTNTLRPRRIGQCLPSGFFFVAELAPNDDLEIHGAVKQRHSPRQADPLPSLL